MRLLREPSLTRRRGLWIAAGLASLLALALLHWDGSRSRRDPPDGLAEDTLAAEVSLQPTELPDAPVESTRAPAEASSAQRTTTDESAGATVFGSLLAASGELAPAARVGLYDHEGDYTRARVTGGAYRASGLSPGDWWLNAGGDGLRPQRIALEALREGEERRVDVELHAAVELAIWATTPEGDPLRLPTSPDMPSKGATELVAVATREPLGALFLERVGSENNPFGAGRFARAKRAERAEGLLGHIQLTVAPPVHVALTCYQGVVASQLVPPGQERVDFVLSAEELAAFTCGLRFFLFDDSGAFLPQNQVTLSGPGISHHKLGGSPGQMGEWLGLPPGEYALHWLERGFYRSFELVAGETRDLGSIVLRDIRQVRGRVRLPDGSAPPPEGDGDLPASLLFAIDLGRWGMHVDDSMRFPTGSEGEFALELLPGVYTLQWRGRNHASLPFSVDTRAGDATLEVTAHELATLVLVPPAETEGLALSIVDARGNELERCGFSGPWPLQLALVPGWLRVRVTDGSRTILDRSVLLEPDGTRVVIERSD